MFDIGFTELLLIGVVALIVVGPERLPSLIRTSLGYIRQFKSSFSHIKHEVERELELADLKKDLLDSEESISKAVGYDELHESLNDLRKESKNITNFSIDDEEEDLDEVVDKKFVDDEQISDDLNELQSLHGPQLPDPDDEKSTGIEQDPIDELPPANSESTKS